MKIAQSFFKNNKATDLWKIYMAYKTTVSGRRREDVDIRPTGIIKKEKNSTGEKTISSGKGRGASKYGAFAGWAIKGKLRLRCNRVIALLLAQEEMAGFLKQVFV